jgi:hypothetical protein
MPVALMHLTTPLVRGDSKPCPSCPSCRDAEVLLAAGKGAGSPGAAGTVLEYAFPPVNLPLIMCASMTLPLSRTTDDGFSSLLRNSLSFWLWAWKSLKP